VPHRHSRREAGIVPTEQGRAPATRMVAGAARPGSQRDSQAMKKLLAVALLSIVAIGWSTGSVSALGHCHKCYPCAAQYNAFSPFCFNTVMTHHGFHHCCHVADAPCCYPPPCGFQPGYGVCGPVCCEPGTPGSAPSSTTPSGSGTAVTPGAQTYQPPAPAPLPHVPGATSQMWSYPMQGGMVQPAAYRPVFYAPYNMPNGYVPQPAPGVPSYWYNGN
jgi:hypothetical protein